MRLRFALPLLLQLSLPVLSADTAAWRSRAIYFALTDRIARGSGDMGGSACGNLGDYCGGTFQGLESKLDYIKGMGFDAIWITPVVTNSDGGYHGYWAEDLDSINSHYGSADDLKSLVNAAHSKGFYMMVDVVANHMGYANISDDSPPPLNQASSYHAECDIDYNNQTSVQNCWISGLPDLDTQSPTIRSLYQDWVSNLVSTYGFDGVRIDTVKHVEQDYWPGFVNATGVYCIGEVFDGDPNYLLPYASLMPGLLNYAIYYPMTRFFLQQGSSQDMVNMHDQIGSMFPDPTALGTFDLWRSGFNTQSDMYDAISKLTYAKHAVGGLADNDHKHLYVADTAYAFSRAGGKMVALTTNSGSGSSAQHCFGTQVPNGSWQNVFDEGNGPTYSADGNGQLCLNVSNGQPIVLLSS
ncbi:glycoside hydrolase family 13 protein [Trichoderma longibrachiatum ATCC 18648]|uniref:Glycoside hydrolase family 13 protein n=1 Tax=Trichoderma longibrachiatum ATCC 18648 TaxID=983965 RepID=A0A2T4CEA8_TRILO|nr:glycoside hydrolase family 13 protein [Trichoderma longibrachiatum ATCC 18648]